MPRLPCVPLFALLLPACGAGVDAPQARLADFRSHLDQGKAALEAKRHDEAVAALTKATELMPGDSGARDLLSRATEERREARYEGAMAAGQEAAKANQHERAVAAFAQALENKPGDPRATASRRRSEFSLRLDQGNAAMAANRLEEAVHAFGAASALEPEDTAASGLLAKAQAARAAEVKELFGRAMAAGEKALRGKSHQAALASFSRALELVPGDPAAAGKKEEAEFLVHLERGEKALKEGRAREAVTSLEAASRLKAGNKAAAVLLERAREERKKEVKAEYARAVGSGKSALSGRRYDEAIRYFKEARPGPAGGRGRGPAPRSGRQEAVVRIQAERGEVRAVVAALRRRGPRGEGSGADRPARGHRAGGRGPGGGGEEARLPDAAEFGAIGPALGPLRRRRALRPRGGRAEPVRRRLGGQQRPKPGRVEEAGGGNEGTDEAALTARGEPCVPTAGGGRSSRIVQDGGKHMGCLSEKL